MSLDGRGRWYRWQKKDTVDDYLNLRAHHVLTNIAPPDRPGAYTLTWHRGEQEIGSIAVVILAGGQGARLVYNHRGQPVEPYVVRWVTTTPHFGGARYWWLCPHCARRCAILYGGHPFLCRQCRDLTYETAQKGGDRLTVIDNRLRAIRRRLGASTGAGWVDDPLPEKPPYMHLDTYLRLAREYRNLAELRDQVWMLDTADVLGPAAADLAGDLALCRKMVDAGWAAYRENPGAPTPADVLRAHELARALEAADQAPPKPRPERFTLGELASLAAVPYDFAKEAARAGLIRPDAGRTTRRRRYRRKLAGWLGKLHTLRAAGLTWDDLRAWAARRWQPGHEHERRWPAGYTPAPLDVAHAGGD